MMTTDFFLYFGYAFTGTVFYGLWVLAVAASLMDRGSHWLLFNTLTLA